MVKEHFAEGGLGYEDTKSIFYLVKLGHRKRSKQQTEVIVNYLRSVSKTLAKSDISLVRAAAEKLTVESYTQDQ